MLRAVGLALNHDVGWEMGNTYGAVGPVDMLSTGSRSTIGVNSKIFFLNIDFDRIIDHREDTNAGETRMAPSVGIERGDANQSVDTAFAS